jgi:hypothetical protein
MNWVILWGPCASGKGAARAPGFKWDFTGERFTPRVEGDIRLERIHRYLVACLLVHGMQVLDTACGGGYGSDSADRHRLSGNVDFMTSKTLYNG